MPFDAAGYDPKPAKPEKPRPGNNLAAALVIVVSFLMLATPFSLAACSDLVRTMHAH